MRGPPRWGGGRRQLRVLQPEATTAEAEEPPAGAGPAALPRSAEPEEHVHAPQLFDDALHKVLDRSGVRQVARFDHSLSAGVGDVLRHLPEFGGALTAASVAEAQRSLDAQSKQLLVEQEKLKVLLGGRSAASAPQPAPRRGGRGTSQQTAGQRVKRHAVCCVV